MTGRRDTNTTTHFLREPRALALIRDAVAAPAAAAGRRAVVWSVGCSTGDEPYGLAMVCREAGVDVDILATDVNPDALARATRGRYPDRNLRHVDDARRGRWFRPAGAAWEVAPDLRACVRFLAHDITREGAPRHDVDVVLCRNVIVYFTPDELRRALATMAGALRPGGLVILGASEWLRADLRARPTTQLVPVDHGGVIAYQRVDERGAATRALPLPPRETTPPVPSPPREATPPAPSPARPPRPDALAPEVATLRAEGDALLDAGRPREAAACYARAAARAPLVADLHLRIALAHLHADDAEPARAALRRSLFLTPALWPAWILLADLSHEDADVRRCLAHARELLESPATPDLAHDPLVDPFVVDRRVALDAIRRRLGRGRDLT